MRFWDHTRSVWLAQRGHLFPWTPVALGLGVGAYFSSKIEPTGWHYLGLGLLCLLLLSRLRRASNLLSPLLWAGVLIVLGVCLAGLRAHLVADPILGWRYYGPAEGRIVGIDRSASDALRLTLDQVRLANVSPNETPGRIRVALHGQQGFVAPKPGLTVILTAHLSPPSGPVEPAGFDFQRHAWFQGLGAVGYTRTPVLALAPPKGGQWVFKARMWLSGRVKSVVEGETGAFAAAIITGDRSDIGQETLTALRISNLAHLLAISGLHMGLLAGFVFGAFRLIFAAMPRIGLRVPSKKLSAVCALSVAAAYLALSGGNVATERAFIMVAVMLCAVMVDRRALSLRAVALAAIIVLILRPEALLGPGFQMSFAATTALVAVFGQLRDRDLALGPRWLRPAAAVVLSSLVAGLATAPIAAAHFNQIAHYGLLANLLSVPLMGILVIPAAVLAVCLLPFGLDGLPLWAMGQGLDWILGVADWVSSLNGARGTVMSPAPYVLPLIVLGGLTLVLWQGRLRMAGVLPVMIGIGLWVQADRPVVLISDTGSLVGVMTPAGRALSREKGGGFVAMNWLENDGDGATQQAAFERWSRTHSNVWPVIALSGKASAEGLSECHDAKWVVLNVEPEKDLDHLPCHILSPKILRQTGAIAFYEEDGNLKQVTARQVTGARLWNTQ